MASPYARKTPIAAAVRPQLHRDPSSQALALARAEDGQGGGEADNSFDSFDERPRSRNNKGGGGLLGRIRKSIGWLTGRSAAAVQDDNDAQEDEEEELATNNNDDEESRMTGRNTAASRSMLLPAGIPAPPPPAKKRDFTSTATAASVASRSQLDGDSGAPESAKRIRTSHSTLNLPGSSTAAGSVVPANLARLASPSMLNGSNNGRARSPLRNPSPTRSAYGSTAQSQLAAGQSRMFNLPTSATFNGLPNSSRSSMTVPRRSMSPGTQYALAPAPVSGGSTSTSLFGLQSQSPFKSAHSATLPPSSAGGALRSPDFTGLNISNGLARSPSVPRERLAIQQQQGSRLYPYSQQQRPSSALSYASGAGGGLPTSFSVGANLSFSGGGQNKRSYGSMSPTRISPMFGGYPRPTTGAAGGGSNISPTSTDFSEYGRTAKRQKKEVVWQSGKGFVAVDVVAADGGDDRLENGDEGGGGMPKNAAELTLERLENLRRPQLDSLRNRVGLLSFFLFLSLKLEY